MKCNNCGNEFEGKFCPECGTASEEQINQIAQPQPPQNDWVTPAPPMQKPKKPFYKKWWFWVIVVIVVFSIIGGITGNEDDQQTAKPIDNTSSSESQETSSSEISKPEVTVADFSTMSKKEIEAWAKTNKITCDISDEYSDTVENGKFIAQNINANEAVEEGSTIEVTFSLGKKPSIEFLNALKKAESYSKLMHMSKKGIYDQLTSEYGEKFPEDAAQYAIDNMKADWKENALEKAKSYQESMSMSKSAIYDQLISSHGEKFTKEEAKYAIEHLDD